MCVCVMGCHPGLGFLLVVVEEGGFCYGFLWGG